MWPEIWHLAMECVQEAHAQGTCVYRCLLVGVVYLIGYEVCVLDAAVLLQAKWDTGLHEVWGTIISYDEVAAAISNIESMSFSFPY